MRPGVNGTVTVRPASFAAFSIAALPPRTIRPAIDTFLPNSFRIASSFERTFANSGGLFTSQSFWGAGRMRPPSAPPRFSDPRNVDAAAQALATGSERHRRGARVFTFGRPLD